MLTKPDKHGIPTLQVVKAGNTEIRHLEKLYTTAVVKRKTSLKFNGRLCDRGDLCKPEVPLEYSAPAVSRCSPRFVIALSVPMGFTIGVMDVSSAFTQSDLVG